MSMKGDNSCLTNCTGMFTHDAKKFTNLIEMYTLLNRNVCLIILLLLTSIHIFFWFAGWVDEWPDNESLRGQQKQSIPFQTHEAVSQPGGTGQDSRAKGKTHITFCATWKVGGHRLF